MRKKIAAVLIVAAVAAVTPFLFGAAVEQLGHNVTNAAKTAVGGMPTSPMGWEVDFDLQVTGGWPDKEVYVYLCDINKDRIEEVTAEETFICYANGTNEWDLNILSCSGVNVPYYIEVTTIPLAPVYYPIGN